MPQGVARVSAMTTRGFGDTVVRARITYEPLLSVTESSTRVSEINLR